MACAVAGAMSGGEARSGFLAAASVAIVGAALYFARDFLLPLSLAVLLAFVLHPMLRRLERWGLPRAAGVILIAFLLAAIAGVAVWLVGREVSDLTAGVSEFRGNLVLKLRALRGPIRSFADAMGWIDQLSKEMDPAHGQGAAPQVEVVQPQTPVSALMRFGTPVLGTLGVLGVVMMLTLFLLLQRDLPQRLASFLQQRDSRISPRALEEAGRVVTGYLLRQGLVCLLQGVIVALGLTLIGVPGALLFGFLSAILRSIPYFGPTTAAALPIAFCLVAFKGWEMALYSLAFFLALELFTNNVLDPRVLGRGAGLSPLGVILAASFWAWLWGPAGLFVAIPLTACLAVAGRYVPQLAFLPALLGHAQMLSPSERFYECLVARDRAEAEILLRHTAREVDGLELSDALVLPVLVRLARERSDGLRSGSEVVRMLRTFRDLLVEAIAVTPAPAVRPSNGKPVRIVQLRAGELDRFARDWIANVLEQRGFRVRERRKSAPEDTHALLLFIAPVGERGLRLSARARLAERADSQRAVLLVSEEARELGNVGGLQLVRSTVALIAALAPTVAAVAPAEARAAVVADAEVPAR